MKRAYLLSLIVAGSLAALGALPAGCGTGAGEDVFTSNPGSSDNGSGGASSQASSGSMSTSGGDASSASSGGAGGDATTSSSSASSASSSASSSSGGGVTLDCGNVSCELPPDTACCWHNS